MRHNSEHAASAGVRMGASVGANRSADERGRVHGRWRFEARDSSGRLKWRDVIDCNMIVLAGLDHLLDATLSGGSQITTWYIGLADGTPTPAAADTMGSHAGWTEVTDYSEGARQTWVDAGVSGQSVDNSASKAEFNMNDTATVGGAFLSSDSAKSGSSGTLFAIGAFTGGDKSLVDGDTLTITATFTMADS